MAEISAADAARDALRAARAVISENTDTPPETATLAVFAILVAAALWPENSTNPEGPNPAQGHSGGSRQRRMS